MRRDAELLRRYAEVRDPEAFAELVKRYAGLVHSACLRVTGHAQDAEDASQECFMALARSAGSIAAPLPAWLHVPATNRARNTIRASSRRKRREELSMAQKRSEAEPTWAEIEPHVDDALLGLPEELRLPIILHYLKGMTQAQAAEEMAVDQSTVSRRIEKGIGELRTRLAKVGAVASASLVAGLLTENASGAVPSALETSLAKMAVAGVGGTSGGATALAAGSAILGSTSGKLAVAVVVCLLAISGAVAYKQLAPPGPRPLPSKPAAAAKAPAASRASRSRPAAPVVAKDRAKAASYSARATALRAIAAVYVDGEKEAALDFFDDAASRKGRGEGSAIESLKKQPASMLASLQLKAIIFFEQGDVAQLSKRFPDDMWEPGRIPAMLTEGIGCLVVLGIPGREEQGLWAFVVKKVDGRNRIVYTDDN